MWILPSYSGFIYSLDNGTNWVREYNFDGNNYNNVFQQGNFIAVYGNNYYPVFSINSGSTWAENNDISNLASQK